MKPLFFDFLEETTLSIDTQFLVGGSLLIYTICLAKTLYVTFAPATRARALDLVHVFLLLTCLARMSDWGARQEKEVSAKRPFSPS